MKDLKKSLEELCGLFERLGISYAVMGGIAIRAYGIPRPTHDIDFTLAIERENLPSLFKAVSDLGYTVPEGYTGGWVDQVAGMPLVKCRFYMAGNGIDIDIFLAESAFQKELLSRRRRESVDDYVLWLVSPEDLILLKLLANRPRDIADIGDVLFTQGQLDEAYMRTWANQIGVLPGLEKVLGQPPIL